MPNYTDKQNQTNAQALDLCTELQSKLWSLEATLNAINCDYNRFYRDLSWAHYGDFILIKHSIEHVVPNLNQILDKMEKGQK